MCHAIHSAFVLLHQFFCILMVFIVFCNMDIKLITTLILQHLLTRSMCRYMLTACLNCLPLSNSKPSLKVFLAKIKIVYDIERQIAAKNNKLTKHYKK